MKINNFKGSKLNPLSIIKTASDNADRKAKENLRLNCKDCFGSHYVLHQGKKGAYFRCSNYPECDSTISVAEFLSSFQDNIK